VHGRWRQTRHTRLAHLCFDANDPVRLATFWSAALGWEIDDSVEGFVRVRPTDGTSFGFDFLPVPEPKTWKNPLHLEVLSESDEQQPEVVDRLLSLGARRIDVGQGPDDVVLADPEGNELCVFPRNDFFADTGVLCSIAFEPAHPTTGYFWGEALGWPVVYDEAGDTAVRAPDGTGPFLTFGPPGVNKRGKNRLHLDLAPDDGEDQSAEVERLLALGATRVDIGQGDVPWVVLADPNGNELCVLRPE
jgi:catechol 2,3-dioxygenase-like lactoylglutathione lyase family enzyme